MSNVQITITFIVPKHAMYIPQLIGSFSFIINLFYVIKCTRCTVLVTALDFVNKITVHVLVPCLQIQSFAFFCTEGNLTIQQLFFQKGLMTE